MGIKLDWHVESDQTQLRATEDPEARRRRQQTRRQFLAVLAALTIVVGAVVVGIVWRLHTIENRIRQDLIDTVLTEITALRIGNFGDYIDVQRSSSDAFILEQQQRFNDYQRLIQAGRVQLTGEVISVAIDDRRGRVVVQEVLDGIPMQQVWFYWRYEDATSQSGWRHVPDDLTFWGAPRTIETAAGTIRYQDLDSALAQALAAALPEWWARGCALIACPTAPPAPEIAIVAERPAQIGWSAAGSWTLRVPSPLIGRARADSPLPPDLARSIAEQLALRLVRFAAADSVPALETDAAWLERDLARWMAQDMTSTTVPIPPSSGLVESLIAQYGPGVPGALLSTLSGVPSLETSLRAITGLGLSQLSPDQLNGLAWRDFFQWRLALEPVLLQTGQPAAFQSLYDLNDVNAAGQAAVRLESPGYAAQPVPVVREVAITQEGGNVYAFVRVTHSEDGVTLLDTTIIWRVADGTWKRVN